MHLTTGFVGTPYFCNVLSENGANDFAYSLLLNEDYPSWLYAVKLGATTIWERWNSVLSNGSISDTGMNSLNHYAYGSIAQWMYQQMCGINPVDEAPGFRKIKFSPKPYGKLTYAKASVFSASGIINSGWEIKEDGSLSFSFTIPFNSTAEVFLPDALLYNIKVNNVGILDSGLEAEQLENNVRCVLAAGNFVFEYMPNKNYILTYSSDSSLKELLENEETKNIIVKQLPGLVEHELIQHFSESTLRELIGVPLFINIVTPDILNQLDQTLLSVRM
jgi:alpha-L-rhamnosidase